MSRRTAVAMLLISSLAADRAMAQDSNYWTNIYGTRSILLSGSVIGGPIDLATIYYNPGGLALLKDPGTVLTVKAFEFANISLPDAGGRGVDLDDPRSSVLPTFVGGLVGFQFLGSDALAYSFFPRQGLRTNITGRTMEPRDVLPSPGLENRFGEVRLEQDLDESWFGATWTKRLSDQFGVGISPYVAVRNQKTRAQAFTQALGSDSTGAANTTIRAFQYTHYRLLAKLGAAMKLDKTDLGLTLTTPGVKLLGSGEAGIDRYRLGEDVDGDGVPDNIYGVSFQQDLTSTWKSPLSIGAGARVPFGRTTLYVSGEWFDSVDRFSVLDVGTVTDVVSGQPIPFQVEQQAKSVTNGAIGLEHEFNAKFTGYASFSTDYSSAVNDGREDTSVSNWDIYLVTGGTTFKVGKSEFTLGAGYAFGNHEADVPPSLADSGAANDFGTRIGTVHYSSVHLIFGFSI